MVRRAMHVGVTLMDKIVLSEEKIDHGVVLTGAAGKVSWGENRGGGQAQTPCSHGVDEHRGMTRVSIAPGIPEM